MLNAHVHGTDKDAGEAPDSAVNLAADLERAAKRIEELERLLLEFCDAAVIDPLMSGPALMGFNQSSLRRLWPKVRAALKALLDAQGE